MAGFRPRPVSFGVIEESAVTIGKISGAGDMGPRGGSDCRSWGGPVCRKCWKARSPGSTQPPGRALAVVGSRIVAVGSKVVAGREQSNGGESQAGEGEETPKVVRFPSWFRSVGVSYRRRFGLAGAGATLAAEVFSAIRGGSSTPWLVYMLCIAVFLIFVLYPLFRFGAVRLGPDDSEPEYTVSPGLPCCLAPASSGCSG